MNPLLKIKNLRLSNVNRVITGNLNINSLTSKFYQLKEIVLKYIDILVITKIKLDDTFPSAQFLVPRFSKPFRLDRNRKGGGVMIYVRENIPSKLLTKHVLPSDIECIFLELNFRKCQWLLVGTYHPPSQNDHYFFENLDKAMKKFYLQETLMKKSSKFCLDSFLYQHELKNLIKEKTCFKNVSNPSCIDLFLTNNALSFQHTETVSTDLSDFHELVLTVLKTTISKSKPREILYRNYNKFDSLKLNIDLKNAFAHEKIKSCLQFDKYL